MSQKRIAFYTLGCKLNFTESSNLASDLQDDYDVVGFSDVADFYVIQSCVVTAAAEKKCRAAIRQANKRNPAAGIIVMGCMSQLRANQLEAMEEVSLVLGSSEKFNLKDYLQNHGDGQPGKVRISNILKNKNFHASYSGSDRKRVFVKIQDGCDYFCSYCTIPLARGLSRSNTINETVDLIQQALAEKPREIILTGVNIGDFGKPNNESFLELLQRIEGQSLHVRIRLSSVEPDLLSDEIISLISNSEKFMPHFHIPLQSGSDEILKKMKRSYAADIFKSRVEKIKSLMPDACIASDVIAGFPGESGAYFLETYQLIEQLPLSYLHVFPFSERPGTMAARLPEKVEKSIINDRVRKLIELHAIKKRHFLDENRGRTEEVLFETKESDGYISGFTTNYIRVKAKYHEALENSVRKTKLIETDDEGNFLFEPVL